MFIAKNLLQLQNSTQAALRTLMTFSRSAENDDRTWNGPITH